MTRTWRATSTPLTTTRLLQQVARRIADRSVLRLIRLWLRCPVVEDDDQGGTTTDASRGRGRRKGGVISPLLANIYLHDFDRAFHGPDGPAQFARARLVRYADDFVVLARYMGPRLVGVARTHARTGTSG